MGCDGGYLPNAWDYLTEQGIVSDDCMPYVSADSRIPQCPQSCSNNAPFKKYKCKPDTIIEATNPDQIKSGIYAGGPMESTMEIYTDFFNYKSGVYQHASGSYAGGHAIKIIGWGKENGVDYWLCANSWGTTWGDNGFFKIAFNMMDPDTPAYACTPETNGVSEEEPLFLANY